MEMVGRDFKRQLKLIELHRLRNVKIRQRNTTCVFSNGKASSRHLTQTRWNMEHQNTDRILQINTARSQQRRVKNGHQQLL